MTAKYQLEILHRNAESVPDQGPDPSKKEALPCNDMMSLGGKVVVKHKCREEETADGSVLDEVILDPVTLEV